jgi:hypothetical protein
MQRVITLLGLTLAVLVGLAGAASAGGTAPKVPEPASMTLFAVGAGAVAFAKFRKRK